MSEYGLELARKTLKEFRVPFREVRIPGGTALVFPDCELAWAAYEVFELKGAGPRMLSCRAVEVVFYD